ncbi:hypothetical protein BYT27DRAFT_7181631 [Phlegmacium glaucopus]|nr:hypothetical protein BYT27DRAFT_7181631 [Phlegmacium glaucopus]
MSLADALKKPPFDPSWFGVNHCIIYHPKTKEKTNDSYDTLLLLLFELLCVMRDRF